MYIPKQFKNENKEEILHFIKEHSFGVLFSQQDNIPTATHLPFIVSEEDDRIILFTHMAKANPQWKTLNGKAALAVFNGPHAYISASWYEEENTVSTWNYVSAHVQGTITVVTEDEALIDILKVTTEFYEKEFEKPWKLDNNLENVQSMLGGIVGIKLVVEKLDGKWKLNQHHSLERKEKVINQLKKQTAYDSHEIAKLMEKDMKK